MTADADDPNAPNTPALTRRHALALAAALPALLAAAPDTPTPAPRPGLTSIPARGSAPPALPAAHDEAVPRTVRHTDALHLARRATYGPTPTLVRSLTTQGTRAWLEQQLDPQTIPDPTGAALDALYPETRWTIPRVHQAVAAGTLEPFAWNLMHALGQYTLAKATWSTRQLLELMVEFWSNHLNVTNPSDSVWDNRHDYDRVVIRAHALGRYADMLAASAAHPAMLGYLNQDQSTKAHPNENYGRELLELHTVGVSAGYTEAMVLDSARIMTGYTIDDDPTSPRYRQHRYNPDVHWTGNVRVLDFTHTNTSSDGRTVATSYLDYLARHPATARHIATKLAIRFVSDTPPAGLVDQLAGIYLAHDTHIVPVLRALFTSAAFAASRGHKIRRPYDDLIGTLRTLDYRLLPDSAGPAAQRRGLESLYWAATDLGHAPLAWTTPDGYPDTAGAWVSAAGLLERWNMHQNLASGWWPAADTITAGNPRAILGRRPSTYQQLVNRLATRLTGQPLPPADTAAVLTFLHKQPHTPVRAHDPAVTWDLERLIALILATANHQVR